MPEAADRQDAFAPPAAAQRPKLYRFSERMVGSAVEGKDAVQVTLIKGKCAISLYFTSCARFTDARFSLATIAGAPGIFVRRGDGGRHVILLTWRGDRVSCIRDFFHFSPAAEVAEIREVPG